MKNAEKEGVNKIIGLHHWEKPRLVFSLRKDSNHRIRSKSLLYLLSLKKTRLMMKMIVRMKVRNIRHQIERRRGLRSKHKVSRRMHNRNHRKNNEVKKNSRIKDYTKKRKRNKRPKNKSKESKGNNWKASKKVTQNNLAIIDKNKEAKTTKKISRCSNWFSF